MNKPGSPSRWYQPWRSADARKPVDPADLGTCFGLELSLAAEHDSKPAPKTAVTARRMGWMQRLTSRRRAAA
jgi:hypothetical protein